MSFFSNIISVSVKIALTPVAILKDGYEVVTGEEPDNTKKLLESASDDVKEGLNDIWEGDLL